MIWLTGNLSYLNHLTAVFTLILISDTFLAGWLTVPEVAATPLAAEIVVTLIGTVLVGLQMMRLVDHFYPNRTFQRFIRPFLSLHIVNRYGIFAVMTTKRYEIVVEGSNDGDNWEEYLCKYKPSELNRRPRRVSPYQPRLDWQMWFLPFTDYNFEPWFQNFLYRLLEGSPEVLKLLRHNPFPDTPPKYVRAVAYDYTFTTPEEKKKTGHWWNRTFAGHYSPTLSVVSVD